MIFLIDDPLHKFIHNAAGEISIPHLHIDRITWVVKAFYLI